ncbi:MAG: PqqD family peptide modification chaperone [Acidimicrobiales bacterium]
MPAELSVVHFEARGRSFEVHCDRSVHDAVASMLGSLTRRKDGGGACASRFAIRRERATPHLWSVRVDGRPMMSGELLADALDAFMMFVNQRVVSAREDVLSIHAAGVVVDGVGVVMPAPSGGGKTTLCARLVQQGAAYLSDESVGLAPDGMVLGYPKPLGFKRGTLESFGDVDLSDVDLGAGPQSVWQVPPARLGAHTAATAVASLVVLPRFAALAPLRTDRVTRAVAAQELISQALNLRTFGTAGALAVVGRVVAGCTGWAVSFGDGRDAAAAVLEVAGTHRAGPPVPFLVVRAPAADGGPGAGPVPAADVSALCFEEGAVLVREGSGATATTDRIGALVWPLLDGSRTEKALAEELSASFDAPAGQVEADVARWIDQLVELGFVLRP